MEEKIFLSLDNEHEINTSIIDDISWFQIIKFNPEKPKTFILLIKEVIDHFRKKNILYIKQTISKDDVPYFKNSNINEIDEFTYIISTPISKFIDDLVCALGIKLV
jgi:hypothetical protein